MKNHKQKDFETAFYRNSRNQITFNALCERCQRDCKQSFRVTVIKCPKYTRLE